MQEVVLAAEFQQMPAGGPAQIAAKLGAPVVQRGRQKVSCPGYPNRAAEAGQSGIGKPGAILERVLTACLLHQVRRPCRRPLSNNAVGAVAFRSVVGLSTVRLRSNRIAGRDRILTCVLAVMVACTCAVFRSELEVRAAKPGDRVIGLSKGPLLSRIEVECVLLGGGGREADQGRENHHARVVVFLVLEGRKKECLVADKMTTQRAAFLV